MNYEIITKVLRELENVRNSYASGDLTYDNYREAERGINARLNVYGLALSSIAATPPF